MNRLKGRNFIIPSAIVGVFLLVFPMFSGPYYAHILILTFLSITLALGYRLLYVTGLVSFGYITLYAIGAYISALCSTRLGLPFGICFLLSGIGTAVVAAVLILVTARVKGVYFFMVTFGFWGFANAVFTQWRSVFGGEKGIVGIPPIMGLTTVTPYYYMILAFVAGTIFFMYRLYGSRFGTELLAIGDSADLAEVSGINVLRHRVLAHAIGGLFAGFAGSIFAHYTGFICPSMFTFWGAMYIIVWCVIGGYRKFWGPIAGAASMVLIAEFTRMSGTLQAILYAAVLLTFIMVIPHGISGLVDTLRARRVRLK